MPESPPEQQEARVRRRPEEPAEPRDTEGPVGAEPILDPFWCQVALPIQVGGGHGAEPSVAQPMAPLREDLQNLLTGSARRVAWGGDRRKGSARIELSEGALAGATLIVHTEQRSVDVELELPAGGAGSGALELQQRIADRLEGRGFSARVRVG